MQNSLLYYRHNSENDSYLNTDKFPRNRDHNTSSKGPLRHFGYSMLLNSQPRIMHFAYTDWFARSRLSAHIPLFDLIW